MPDTFVIACPGESGANSFKSLRRSPHVEWVEVDSLSIRSQVVPNDPWYANWQPFLRNMNCPEAWSQTLGNGIKVAVLDTGSDFSHPDLAPSLGSSFNAMNGGSNAADSDGHGTAVAGTIAAQSNNWVGVASVAWSAQVLTVKISDGWTAYESDIADGLVWAANQGARVANISWSPLTTSALFNAADYFRSRNGVVVTSAGNDATDTGLAESRQLITVSASDGYDVLATYSSFGENVDVNAPGKEMTTQLGGGYFMIGGTSISAPHVAGICALILSANPALTPAEVENILEQSADDLGEPGWDKYYGWGRVNAGRAVLMAMGTSTLDAMPPSAKIEDPAVEGTVLTGLKTLWATADDDRGVAWVRFRVDGVAVSQQLTSAPYTETINTENWADGTHEISVVACDTSGNTTTVKRSVTFLNNDSVPPTISITSPADGSSFSRTLTVEVSVWDNLRISHVEAYIDGVKLGSTSTAPYTMKPYVRNLSKGNHTLYCVAYDGKLNKGYSQTITISNAGGGGGGGGKGNGK